MTKINTLTQPLPSLFPSAYLGKLAKLSLLLKTKKNKFAWLFSFTSKEEQNWRHLRAKFRRKLVTREMKWQEYMKRGS
jgi:hypothetical protein